MSLFFTPLHIFIATFAGFIVGMIWFSPVLFIKAWLKGEGMTKEQLPERSALYLTQVNVYSFIAHMAIASLLAVLFDLLLITSLTGALSLGLLLAFGFVIPTRFIDMVYTVHGKHYEAKPQLKFLVSSGYYLTVFAVMSVTLCLVTL